MDAWIEKMERQVTTIPPSCLNGFNYAPASAEEWDEWAAWTLACQCGCTHGALLGYPLSELNPDYEAEPLFMSPLNFRCSSCGAKTQIIDTKEHGYNSEIARLEGEQSFDSNYRGSGQPQEALCPQCEGSEFSITVKCLHSHFDLIEDEPDLEPRVQDFFDGFECFGTCSSCGEMTSFAGCELA